MVILVFGFDVIQDLHGFIHAWRINHNFLETTFRQRKAYPVYDAEYRQHLQVIQDYLEAFDNLQTVGRNGMHRYNNQDHSMLTAMLAVRNLFGENHDLWAVNTERSYHEEFTTEDQKTSAKLSSVLRSSTSDRPKAVIQ